MTTRIHPNARTTPRTREEIHHSNLTQSEIMARYSISKATASKWQNREEFTDRSHRPHTLHTTLSSAQEALVVILRTTLLLPLDDLVAVTHHFINPDASRSGVNRLLVREGIGNLKDMQAALNPEEETSAKKGFKDYAPGYFHMDIKYLPQMPDETERRYLFVAIDRATRWVFLRIYPNIVAALLTSTLVKAHINDADEMGLTPWIAANLSMKQSLWSCNPAIFDNPFKFVPMFVTQPYYISNPIHPYKKTREVLEEAGASTDMTKAKEVW